MATTTREGNVYNENDEAGAAIVQWLLTNRERKFDSFAAAVREAAADLGIEGEVRKRAFIRIRQAVRNRAMFG